MTRHFNSIKLTLITIVILFILYLNVFESDQHFEDVFLKNNKNNDTTVITTSTDSKKLECLHTQNQRQKRIQEYCVQNRVSKE